MAIIEPWPDQREVGTVPVLPMQTDETRKINLASALVVVGLCASESESKRLIRGGGVYVNREKAAENGYVRAGDLISAGKKHHATLTFANPTPTLAPDLAALIRRNTVAGGFANTVAIAEEAFEMGVKSAAPPAVEREGLMQAAINQNDAMRQELAHVGNLVSDLARAMGIDQANADGSWPDLAARVQRLQKAALATPQGSTLHPSDREAIALVVEQAQFLCDRLGDLDWCDLDRTANDFNGHVDPALSRLKSTLAILALSGSLAPEGGSPSCSSGHANYIGKCPYCHEKLPGIPVQTDKHGDG